MASLVAAVGTFSASLCFAQSAPGPTILAGETPKGAVVDEVAAGGPAEKAGISAHDITTTVEGTTLGNLKQIADALARHKPGDTMELTVARPSAGTVTTVTITLGADPRDASRAYMGLTVVGYMFLIVPPEGGTPPAPAQQEPPGI